MKRLKFHYEMELMFDAPVVEHHYVFRCLPMSDEGQQCYGLKFGIEPSGMIHEGIDGFGNRICGGEALAPHDSLKVWAEGTVFVDRSKAVREDVHPLFQFPSPYTCADEALKKYLRECRIQAIYDQAESRIPVGDNRKKLYGLAAGIKRLEFPVYLMDCLYRDFSYKPGTTDVTTTAAQAWAGGQGVCQDYAHIFLSLCRLAGYPARYVAGMMVGEGATHAWTEVYAGGGWTGFDPTHNRLVDDNYIKLSHGRDFGDCTIDRGCFKGFASQRQNIYVKVED